MIRLEKIAPPPVLVNNAEGWTKVLVDCIAAGNTPTAAEKSHYNNLAIKSALIEETFGKCAYCESKVRHITYGDIEHIVPKSARPEKAFEWSNLTLACDVCNTNKGEHFGDHEDLVDPYVVDPYAHFNFLGVVVMPRSESNSGLITERTLKLNRLPLIERRLERLNSLSKSLRLIVSATDPNTKMVLKRDLEMNELLPDKEYAAMSRAYVSEELMSIARGAQRGSSGGEDMAQEV